MIFDPIAHLRSLEEFLIPYTQESDLAEARELRALAGSGSTILNAAIECWLLGVFGTGEELVRKARVFFHAAIEEKEIPRGYARGGAESLRLTAFALCNWLIDKRHDVASLKEAVHWREIWFDEQGSSYKPDVQLTLAMYLDAEEYDALFRRFELAGLKPPKNLRNIKGQGTMSYALARHRLGLEYATEGVSAAIETFLKRNVRTEWLDRGQWETAAEWMKIAFWKPGDDPVATLLKCYDYLPGLEAPQYPPCTPDAGKGVRPGMSSPTSSGNRPVTVRQNVHLAAYWLGRNESPERSADRLLKFFDELAPDDEAAVAWYELGESKEQSLRKRADVRDREYLLSLFSRPDNHTGDIGFHIDLATAEHGNYAIELRISCGMDAQVGGGSVVINFAVDLGPLADFKKMSAVLAAVARAWEPTWAGVRSHEATETRPFEPGKPFVDWMVYLSRELLRDGTVINWPGRVTTLGGRLGAIISTQDEPPDPNNPEHLRNIESVREALGL